MFIFGSLHIFCFSSNSFQSWWYQLADLGDWWLLFQFRFFYEKRWQTLMRVICGSLNWPLALKLRLLIHMEMKALFLLADNNTYSWNVKLILHQITQAFLFKKDGSNWHSLNEQICHEERWNPFIYEKETFQSFEPLI